MITIALITLFIGAPRHWYVVEQVTKADTGITTERAVRRYLTLDECNDFVAGRISRKRKGEVSTFVCRHKEHAHGRNPPASRR